MSYLIALDDGHGSEKGKETPGKRSPKLPDGSVMYENLFNKVVVKYLKEELERNGFKTIETAPTDADTSLKARVDLANVKNVNMFISIHANASKGVFFDGGGVETYHSPGSTEGKKIATLIQDEVMKGNPLRNRGVKNEAFYVLRYTKAVSVLCELGFMDSNQDIKLLMSNTYRKDCARKIAIAVCKYYGVTYKENKPAIKENIKNDEKNTESDALFFVQVAAFSSENNAKNYLKEVQKTYPKAFIKKGSVK